MASKKHVHMYIRVKVSGRVQWTCDLPDCTHFMPFNMPPPIGKQSRCNNCLGTFVLDMHNMQLDKPLCSACMNPETEVNDDYIERREARGLLAKRTGKDLDEVTEAEITEFLAMYKAN